MKEECQVSGVDSQPETSAEQPLVSRTLFVDHGYSLETASPSYLAPAAAMTV